MEIRKKAKTFIDHEGDTIFVVGDADHGYWYVAKGCSTVNFTRDISSNNINDYKDLDCFNWNENINDLETFIEAVEN